MRAVALLLLLPLLAQAEMTCVTPYEAAYYECRDVGTPFVVWVGGFDCPPCRSEIRDWRHIHLVTFAGDDRPRCCVCARVGDRQVYYEVPSPCGTAAIRAAARGERLPQTAPIYQPFVPQQQFVPRSSRGGG